MTSTFSDLFLNIAEPYFNFRSLISQDPNSEESISLIYLPDQKNCFQINKPRIDAPSAHLTLAIEKAELILKTHWAAFCTSIGRYPFYAKSPFMFQLQGKSQDYITNFQISECDIGALTHEKYSFYCKTEEMINILDNIEYKLETLTRKTENQSLWAVPQRYRETTKHFVQAHTQKDASYLINILGNPFENGTVNYYDTPFQIFNQP
jgi:hypothetical protein